MRGEFILAALVLILLDTSAYGETFKGKLIDADTREPIPGAVVVATWDEEMATPTGATTRLKDVKEVLTDKNGNWEIEGPKGRNMGGGTAIVSFLTGTYYTKPPEFIIFKPGYCPWPKGFDIEACRDKLKPQGDNKFTKEEIVELPKLTNREDRLRALPSPIHKDGDMKKEFYKKQKILLRFIDEERRYLGVPEYKILEELGDES